jgi:hypothetical protein
MVLAQHVWAPKFNPQYHRNKTKQMKKLRKCGIYSQWNIIQPYKERKSDQCYSMADLKGIMLSEVSHSQKQKYCRIPWGTQSGQSHRHKVQRWSTERMGGVVKCDSVSGEDGEESGDEKWLFSKVGTLSASWGRATWQMWCVFQHYNTKI